MKDLQECKDEVARKYDCKNWEELRLNIELDIQFRQENKLHHQSAMDEAAELYAEQFKTSSQFKGSGYVTKLREQVIRILEQHGMRDALELLEKEKFKGSGEKPDFKAKAAEYSDLIKHQDAIHKEACELDFVAGCEFTHDDYVLPLQKENEELEAKLIDVNCAAINNLYAKEELLEALKAARKTFMTDQWLRQQLTEEAKIVWDQVEKALQKHQS